MSRSWGNPGSGLRGLGSGKEAVSPGAQVAGVRLSPCDRARSFCWVQAPSYVGPGHFPKDQWQVMGEGSAWIFEGLGVSTAGF